MRLGLVGVCCGCVSSDTVNGVPHGVSSLMGQPGAALHSKGSDPTELAVTVGWGAGTEQICCSPSALPQQLNLNRSWEACSAPRL